MTVVVVFETHSTSVDNERGIATGWLPGELSETGRDQARALGKRRRDVDAVFTSDLRRAVETVEIAFRGTSVPVTTDERLRECDYGALNGVPRSLLETERLRRIDEPFPDGESWPQAVERVAGFLRELAATHDGRRVLVVGHVATHWGIEHAVHGTALEALAATPFVWQPGWEYALAV